MRQALTSPLEVLPISAWSDDALLAAIGQENTAALDELSARYRDKIVRLANRMLRHQQDAEDVAQDVFMTVWNHRHQWRSGEASFSTWIYRVAVNRSIDCSRKRRAPTLMLSDELEEKNITRSDDLVAERETQALLLECLRALPENQRLALQFFYYEELEIEGICRRLSLSEDAVRSLLKRGKVALRAEVSRHFAGDISALQQIAPFLVG